MKKLQFPLLFCLLGGHAMAVPSFDPFANATANGGTSYEVGSSLVGEYNHTLFGPWYVRGTNFGLTQPTIVSGNLSYAGLPTSPGNSIAFAPANASSACIDLNLPAQHTETVYYSFLLKIMDLSAVPTYATNNPIAAFLDDPSLSFSQAQIGRLGSRLVTKKVGDGYVLGIGRSASIPDFVYEPNEAAHNINDVLFVVGCYQRVANVQTNVSLWVNPPAATFGEAEVPTPTLTAPYPASLSGAINNNSARAFGILCQFPHAPDGVIDDVRVATSWALATGGLGFSVQPTNQSAVAGSNVTFAAMAVGASPLTYKWQKDYIDLVEGGRFWGVNTPVLTISNVSHAEAGFYTVAVTNAGKGVISDPALLEVTDPVLDPRILTQPVSRTNLAGTTATFQVVAEGTPPLWYSWLKNNGVIWDAGNISGANTDTLTISDVSSADVANYSVVVMNGLGTTITSSIVSLTIVSPLAVAAQPTSRLVPAGGKTVLAVGVSGTGPVTYQWQFGEANLSGATAASYVLNNVQPEVAGNYRVIATGPVNSVTSSVAAVSILTSPLRLATTNLVVLRIGDGAQTLTARGNSMFLDQFTSGGSLRGTVSIPDSGPTAMVAIGPNVVTLSGGGTSVSGSGLTKSANGQFLVLGAYNTNLSYPADLNNSAATVVPRGIGLVDSFAQYTMVVSSTTSFNSTFFRGAVADGTNNFWGWGRAPGTYYFGFDSPATLVQGDWSNLRGMGIFNGAIYGASSVSGKTGVMTLPGLPTVTNDVQVLIDTGRTSSSDCDVSPDGTIIYVADSAGIANGGGIQRWQFDGGSWSLVYTLANGFPAGAYYVAADFSGPNPVVYAVTTEASNNALVRVEDTGAGSIGSVLAHAGANQTFRGIRMGPAAPASAASPMLSITLNGANVVLDWEGSYFLQSSTGVGGPYTDVINGVRPYTTSTSSTAHRFFRLRQ